MRSCKVRRLPLYKLLWRAIWIKGIEAFKPIITLNISEFFEYFSTRKSSSKWFRKRRDKNGFDDKLVSERKKETLVDVAVFAVVDVAVVIFVKPSKTIFQVQFGWMQWRSSNIGCTKPPKYKNAGARQS